MTTYEIIGNVLTGVGMFLFFLSCFLKRKKEILLLQTGNHTLSSIGQIFLNQSSGSVQDAVSIVRNIFILLKKNNKFWNIFFIVLGVVLGISLNVALNWNDGFYMGLGFLPVFASFQYSVVILFPNIKVPYIKASMAISCVCWTVYGLFLKNYSMAISNVIIFIAAIVAVIRYYVSIRNQEPEEPEEK